MQSDLPNETIKPAYPLGDVNPDVPSQGKTATPAQPPTQEAPKPSPQKVEETQSDGE